MDPIDPPEDIEDVADLEAYLGGLADAHNDLVREVNRLDNLVVKALENSREAEQLRDDIARLRDQVEMVNATMPNQQRGKYEKIRAIIEFAIEEGSGGTAGVKVTTGQAAAAAGASRDTARRLMDEIAATFSWGDVEVPGGPNPKELRISTRRHDEDDLVDDVVARFKGGA